MDELVVFATKPVERLGEKTTKNPKDTPVFLWLSFASSFVKHTYVAKALMARHPCNRNQAGLSSYFQLSKQVMWTPDLNKAVFLGGVPSKKTCLHPNPSKGENLTNQLTPLKYEQTHTAELISIGLLPCD